MSPRPSKPVRRKPASKAVSQKKPTASRGRRPATAPRAKRGAGTSGKAPRPARKAAHAHVAAPLPENPAAHALAQEMAQRLLDKKATDVVILDVRGKTSYADYVVVASGDSERQVSAMADHVVERLREEGRRPLGAEGMATGNWVLLDYGEVVAHLFYAEVRAFYDLEGLWSDAPKEEVA